MKEETKNVIQHILFSLEKILKNKEYWENNAPIHPVSQTYKKNMHQAFLQLCFYEKYKNETSKNPDVMTTEYYKWQTIYNAYQNPQKVIQDLALNTLTKKQQKAIVLHFLGREAFKNRLKLLSSQDVHLFLSKKFERSL